MSTYEAIKWVHLGCVVVTLCGFVLRGWWMMQAPSRLNTRWVRIAPHVVDTLLLVSALWLMVVLQQYPFVHHWLTAKVIALLAYIFLGALALRGRTPRLRITAFVAALLVFSYIVAVALTRQVVPINL